MIVNVYCSRCTDNPSPNDPIPMSTVGVFTISREKWQSQEYICRNCNFMVRVHINTTLDKEIK